MGRSKAKLTVNRKFESKVNSGEMKVKLTVGGKVNSGKIEDKFTVKRLKGK